MSDAIERLLVSIEADQELLRREFVKAEKTVDDASKNMAKAQAEFGCVQ